MRFDAVIFDLDGTLTASETGIIHAAAYAMEQFGAPALPYETMRKFVGPPLMYSFVNYAGLSADEAKGAIAKFRERYMDTGWKENEVYEGIPAMLRALKRAGVHLGVATGKQKSIMERVLAHFHLREYFDAVAGVSPDDNTADKTLLIKAALPEKFERACMVGDRKFDIEAAREMGVEAIGALYGYGTEEELEKAGATQIARTPEQLADILLEGLPREKGRFFSFEGSDGCGKSTQRNLLAEWLKTCGWRVKTTREPGGGPISEAIRELVLNPEVSGMSDECEAYLFAAARAQHVRDTIRPAIERGELVLCDRFLDSSVAYQGAGRGLGEERVRKINEQAVDGTLPDATFWFDVDPLTAMKRRLKECSPDRIEKEEQDFVRRVYAAYQNIAATQTKRVRRVDASGTIEEIQETVREMALAELMR